MISSFVSAARPKTLPAAIIPIVMFSYFLFITKSVFEPTLFLSLVVSTLLIQIATNFYNDYFDYVKGADEIRQGPQRLTQTLSDKKTFLYAGIVTNLVTILVSIPLVAKGGSLIVLIGCLSLLLSVMYTATKFALAYNPVSEIFVFLFFGIIPVVGISHLYDVSITLDSLTLGCMFGVHSNLLLLANNIRDVDQDRKVNKRTLAVYIGRDLYLWLIPISVVFIMTLDAHFIYHYSWKFIVCLIPSLFILIKLKNIKQMTNAELGSFLPIFAIYYVLTSILRGGVLCFIL